MTSDDNQKSELEKAEGIWYNPQLHTLEQVIWAGEVMGQNVTSKQKRDSLLQQFELLVGADPDYQAYKRWSDKQTAKMFEEIAVEKPDLEAFPPSVLQVYQTLDELMVQRHGFVLQTTTGDWYANPNFTNVSFTALYPDHPSIMPVSVSIIYSKANERIATREELCDSLAEKIKADPGFRGQYNNHISISSHQIHGIEMSIDLSVMTSQARTSYYPKEVLEALQGISACSGLKVREDIWQAGSEWNTVGHRIYYVPQTPDE